MCKAMLGGERLSSGKKRNSSEMKESECQGRKVDAAVEVVAGAEL